MEFKKKILSAGCSFIYGAELSDSPSLVGESPPSLKTWPALYARYKGLEYYTCSLCGISNQGIVRYVMDVVENFHVDYVIVQWTFANRYEIRLNELNKNSYYHCMTYWLSKDLSSDNKIILSIKEKEPEWLIDLNTLWYRHVESNLSNLYYLLKAKVELANFLRYKKIPFVFADSEDSYINSRMDKSIETLEKLITTVPSINFENQGFYTWAKTKNFVFGAQHPLENAHFNAFNLVKDNLDKVLFFNE